jgi:hypothetical protein
MKLTPMFAGQAHGNEDLDTLESRLNLGLVPDSGEEDHLPMVTLRNKARRKSTSFVGQDYFEETETRCVLCRIQPYHDVNGALL